MGRYRARDLLGVPCLVSLARVPMAVAFPFVVHEPRLAVALLLVAGASDLFDGWYARTFGQVTPMGAVVDPITDKIFVLTVACTLLVRGALSPLSILMLSTREIGELPLVLLITANRAMRRRRTEEHSANVPGKATTVLQFVAIVGALVHSVHTPRLVLVTAVAGVFSAAVYWIRALR